MLIGILAIQALVYSKIEHWLYSDGIYYSILTMLTSESVRVLY